jgi:hypothetical protein
MVTTYSQPLQDQRPADRSEMPSLLKIILDQSTGAPEDPEEIKIIDAGLEVEYQKAMY